MAENTDDSAALPDLSGKTVVIAGTFDELGRMEVRLGLGKLGAQVVKELDASLDYVVAGVKGGPKLAQALELGIPQLDEPTLVALLAGLEAKKGKPAATGEGPRLPKVDGAVVIIAGTLEVMSRPKAKRQLERLGAIVTDKLDRGVSFVLAGPKGGPTLFNAKELGIPQIDEATLSALVADLPEEEETDDGSGGAVVLAGATVIMAGVPRAIGRKQALARLEKLGATVADRVGRDVQYVFVCQGGASTRFQAKELGLRELDEEALMGLIADVEDDADGAATAGPDAAGLVGKKVLIAGQLAAVGRVEAKRKLTALGAEVVDQLDDDVAWVVAGADGGRNLFLAKQASIPLIDEAALLPLLAQAPEDTADAGPTLPQPEELAGKRVVIAGKLKGVDRLTARRQLQAAGAVVEDKVEAGTSCLFHGEKGGRNLLLALQLHVPTFDESQLETLLAKLPDPGETPADAEDLPDLAGRSVVLAGKFEQLDRRLVVTQLRDLGATLLDQVDDGPDFVIAGKKGGRAVFVAKQESIPVLEEPVLVAVLEQAVAQGKLRPADGTPDTAPSAPDLTGARVAFTGKFPDLDLASLSERLAARGITVQPGFSAETTHLVAGQSAAPMKLVQAKRLGIAQLTVQQMLAFLDREPQP